MTLARVNRWRQPRGLRIAVATLIATALAGALGASVAAPKASAAKEAAPQGAALPQRTPRTDPPPMPDGADWKPFTGEPFFLLTDATYGSDEIAKVRLEVNSPEALAQTGGVDLRLYRVPDPLGFLQKQKNLHRVQVEAAAAAPNSANTLTHLWDSWSVKARVAWQQLFTADARRSVVAEAPALKTPPTLRAPSTFEEPTQYQPIAGLPLIDRFRYPVQNAAAIKPPKDLALAGSSTNFINPSAGNVMVALGKLAPGLYLVEALTGHYRATAMLFVSDSVALTKVSGGQMLVWSTRRSDGAPVPATRVVWTDGVGALKSGATDAQGVLAFDRQSPEQSYVFGVDPKGGVFVSENFYYDSEIYAAKVYAVTDRPLYRPGDTVNVHVTGREFTSARNSVALKDADLALDVIDPLGQAIVHQSQRFSGEQGGDARFALPDGAPGGGYELRLTMGGDTYTAAFRVSEYQKPHFEIGLLPDKSDYKTGEPVAGKLQLNYPDGKPVVRARVSLTARAQKLTMTEGELDYGGQFPLKLTQTELTTDSAGVARFALPAADQPSRYVITALATDGAAYRVRASRELLVERGGTSYRLTPDRQFSRPTEAVTYRVAVSQRSTALPGAALLPAAAASEAPPRPTTWEWVRLENRAKASGTVPAGETFPVTYPLPGSYTLTLRDDRGRIVAATSHWVSGDGLKAPAGSVGIVFDHAQYRAGDTAEALVSFPEPIDHALLTLERDRVESTALLGAAADWMKSERLTPTQWRVRIPVRDAMSPNVTFSVAYVKNGDYVFQNQGLLVEQPRIALAFRTAKAVYAPGERVDVDVSATLGGKPSIANVNVGVVDEMIYVLQPEIAPRIEDFFFHPRRDNVRTTASLAFIGYDLATSLLGDLPSRGEVNQRSVKVLERPRRDNIDTAAWEPRLVTDAAGHARFSFTMPDSLTRWRVTGRAIDASGNVGQQTAWVRSDKAFYAKWTSPNWQREGDQAVAALALFNQTGADASIEWSAQAPGFDRHDKIQLRPGVNFVDLPLAADRVGALPLTLTLRQDGRVVDQLTQPIARWSAGWRAPRELQVALAASAPPAAVPAVSGASTPAPVTAASASAGALSLALPSDATRLRVAFTQDAAAGAFSRSMDALIEFPYGCVEQTASRMLPLSMVLQSLSPSQQAAAPLLTQRLTSARQSLVLMAGPKARFGWWGRDMNVDPFLTAYAYYADWRATQVLRLTLPANHWQHVLEAYADGGPALPPLQRALALSWMQEMRLPVAPMTAALIDELTAANAPAPAAAASSAKGSASFALADRDIAGARDMALVLATATADAARAPVAPAAKVLADAAAARVATLDAPFAKALLMATQRMPPSAAAALLGSTSTEAPTFDRAQTLVWLQRALGHRADMSSTGTAEIATPQLPAPWQRDTGASGEPMWRWPADQPLPTVLPRPAGFSWAYVDFESAQAATVKLPVQLERKLWKLVQRSAAPVAASAASATSDADQTSTTFDSAHLIARLEAVAPGSALDTNALYLDEISVRGEIALRHALVEVALPPGAAVEASTWGVDLESEAGKTVPLERAQQQDTAQGYAIPIDALNAGDVLRVRHLLRFAQRGRFNLPATRLYRMYEPEAKAMATGNAWLKVEVK